MPTRSSKNISTRSGVVHANTPSPRKRQLLLAVTVGVCGLIVALIISFGNPALWVTAEQHKASTFSEETTPEDQAFIDSILSDGQARDSLAPLGVGHAVTLKEDADYAANVATAAEQINGLEIKPGEVFSLNDVLGNVVEDDRYRVADTTKGYLIERQRGGGVDQVASALYIAALVSEMDVIERHPHEVVLDYVPIGCDAAVSYGEMDLRLKNTSHESVFIQAKVSGLYIEVKVFGTPRSSNTTVELVSEIVESHEEPLTEVLNDPEASGVAEFYTVETYCVFSDDGVETKREAVSSGTYYVPA